MILYNFKTEWKPYEGQTFDPKDNLTQPDQDLSLAEILERFTRGEPLEVGRPVYFEEDENNEIDYDKIAGLDLTEREEMANDLRARIAEMQAQLEQAEKQPEPQKGEKTE